MFTYLIIKISQWRFIIFSTRLVSTTKYLRARYPAILTSFAESDMQNFNLRNNQVNNNINPISTVYHNAGNKLESKKEKSKYPRNKGSGGYVYFRRSWFFSTRINFSTRITSSSSSFWILSKTSLIISTGVRLGSILWINISFGLHSIGKRNTLAIESNNVPSSRPASESICKLLFQLRADSWSEGKRLGVRIDSPVRKSKNSKNP